MTLNNFKTISRTGVMCIYKITNKITGKAYVGSTKNLYNRLCEHRHMSKYPDCSVNKMYEDFYNIGLENAEVEILEYCDCTRKELMARETYWTDYLDTQEHGYNISNGKYPAKDRLRAVQQYTLSGEYINTYKSVTEAGRITGTNKGNIWRSCASGKLRAGKYKWKFLK